MLRRTIWIAACAAALTVGTAAPAKAVAPAPSVVTFDSVPVGTRLPFNVGPLALSVSAADCEGSVAPDPDLAGRRVLVTSCSTSSVPVLRATFPAVQAWASAIVSATSIPAHLRAFYPSGLGIAEGVTSAVVAEPPRDGFWSPPVTVSVPYLGSARIGYVELVPAWGVRQATVRALAFSPVPQPDVALTSTPPELSASSTATIAFAVSTPGALFSCTLDDGPEQRCTSPWTRTGLAEGRHTLRVRLIGDDYNDVSGWVSSAFAVDTIAPETAVQVSRAGSPYAEHAVRIHPTANENASFECALDGAGFGHCPPNDVYAGLSPGSHRLLVRAVDLAGNADSTPAEATLNVGASGQPPVTGPAPPEAGRTVTLTPLSGTVRVRIRGRGFVPLDAAASVGVGDTIDARAGRVAVASAADFRSAGDPRHRTQSADLAAAIFTIRQRRAARAAAQTDLVMHTPPGRRRACATRAPKGAIRTLIGAVKGTYRAIAAAATVTVRDAAWTIQDTCNGTRVRARSGTVQIFAKGRRRPISVRPGRSYLVKAKLFAARRTARKLHHRGADR